MATVHDYSLYGCCEHGFKVIQDDWDRDNAYDNRCGTYYSCECPICGSGGFGRAAADRARIKVLDVRSKRIEKIGQWKKDYPDDWFWKGSSRWGACKEDAKGCVKEYNDIVRNDIREEILKRGDRCGAR